MYYDVLDIASLQITKKPAPCLSPDWGHLPEPPYIFFISLFDANTGLVQKSDQTLAEQISKPLKYTSSFIAKNTFFTYDKTFQFFLIVAIKRLITQVVAVVQEKDRVIQQQRIEIERFRGSGVTVSGPVMGVGLDRVRPGSGSIRQHGSFRQYKKDKIRQRNYNSSSESNLSSSTG